MPEFSFRKVPDVQPTALPNPFLVLSCGFVFVSSFRAAIFRNISGKLLPILVFLFLKKKYLQAQFMKQYIKYLIPVHRTSEF